MVCTLERHGKRRKTTPCTTWWRTVYIMVRAVNKMVRDSIHNGEGQNTKWWGTVYKMVRDSIHNGEG